MDARAWFYGPEGFGSTRGNVPTGDIVRKTDEAMARSERGECPFCGAASIDEEGNCTVEGCR